MCDYSLQNVKSRPASVGDKLTTRNFGTGTRGFAAPEDPTTAVCVLPGTELAFSKEIACVSHGLLGWGSKTAVHKTAIFRQINKDIPHRHHDALEFPDGEALAERLRGHGLVDVSWHPMTFGIATLYIGTKKEAQG